MKIQRQWLLAIGAAVVAVLALAAAYSTTSGTSPSTPEPEAGPSGASRTRDEPPPAAERRVSMEGFYGLEPSPSGLRGRWLGPSSTLALRSQGTSWLAFRAASYRTPRVLTLRAAGSEPQRIEIGVRERSYLAGPFKVEEQSRLTLSVSPAAVRGPGDDSRRLSVFMSEPAISNEPVAALPSGFWPAERSPRGGDPYAWMPRRAALELVADDDVGQALVHFNLQGARAEGGLAAKWGRGETQQLDVGEEWSRVELGPVALRGGRATIELRGTPAVRASATDPRTITVRVADVGATPAFEP